MNLPVRSPIAIIPSIPERDQTFPNATYQFGITVTNLGQADVVVRLYLDEPSSRLREWETTKSIQRQLALAKGSSDEVTFQFKIPIDALPDVLNYRIVVEAYGSDAPILLPSYRRELQILPPEAQQTLTPDPTCRIEPATSPEKPKTVQPGVPLELTITVENPSPRVDRFRLECLGLPADWKLETTYQQDYQGLGLVVEADSLGLNPGDRGTIQLVITPPVNALADDYLPTIRIASQNEHPVDDVDDVDAESSLLAAMELLSVVYLRVEPRYHLQTQLQTIQERVRDRPAQFSIQLANFGNTPRQVRLRLKDLEEVGNCRYDLKSDRIEIAPQKIEQVALEGKPLRWWRRPWFGDGKIHNFHIELAAPDGHAIAAEKLPGYFLWMPRPWWQLLLIGLAGLGTLGALAFLIWWQFFRPQPTVQVLEFAAEESRYTEVNQDVARVRWQIRNPDRIQTIKLTGYSPDGAVISGPLVYDLSRGLPNALAAFCTPQPERLTCNNVRTDAFQPGKYQFEMTVIPSGRDATPQTLKTQLVEIVPKPGPQIAQFQPLALAYRESKTGQFSVSDRALPPITPKGVLLDWTVLNPQDLEALHLVGRDAAGAMVGDLWFEFKSGLPSFLKPFCRLDTALVCRSFPTGVNAVGSYRFELSAIARNQPLDPAAKPVTTELVKIQPRQSQILNFQINGKEAPPKVSIPLDQGQKLPVLQIGWAVQGNHKTQVSINPSPGTVPLTGMMPLKLNQIGTTTLTLQVADASGQTVTRSVAIEVYDPTPTDATAVAAATIQAMNQAAATQAASQAAAIRAASQAANRANRPTGSASSGSTPSGSTSGGAQPQASPSPPGAIASPSPQPPQLPGNASSGDSDSLAPADQPPRFN